MESRKYYAVFGPKGVGVCDNWQTAQFFEAQVRNRVWCKSFATFEEAESFALKVQRDQSEPFIALSEKLQLNEVTPTKSLLIRPIIYIE